MSSIEGKEELPNHSPINSPFSFPSTMNFKPQNYEFNYDGNSLSTAASPSPIMTNSKKSPAMLNYIATNYFSSPSAEILSRPLILPDILQSPSGLTRSLSQQFYNLSSRPNNPFSDNNAPIIAYSRANYKPNDNHASDNHASTNRLNKCRSDVASVLHTIRTKRSSDNITNNDNLDWTTVNESSDELLIQMKNLLHDQITVRLIRIKRKAAEMPSTYVDCHGVAQLILPRAAEEQALLFKQLKFPAETFSLRNILDANANLLPEYEHYGGIKLLSLTGLERLVNKNNLSSSLDSFLRRELASELSDHPTNLHGCESCGSLSNSERCDPQGGSCALNQPNYMEKYSIDWQLKPRGANHNELKAVSAYMDIDDSSNEDGIKAKKWSYQDYSTSCHHCRTRPRQVNILLSCDGKQLRPGTEKACYWKYCYKCWDRHYAKEEEYKINTTDQQLREKPHFRFPDIKCPSCRLICRCAACMKSYKKKDIRTSNAEQREATRILMCQELKKKLQDKTSTKQVSDTTPSADSRTCFNSGPAAPLTIVEIPAPILGKASTHFTPSAQAKKLCSPGSPASRSLPAPEAVSKRKSRAKLSLASSKKAKKKSKFNFIAEGEGAAEANNQRTITNSAVSTASNVVSKSRTNGDEAPVLQSSKDLTDKEFGVVINEICSEIIYRNSSALTDLSKLRIQYLALILFEIVFPAGPRQLCQDARSYLSTALMQMQIASKSDVNLATVNLASDFNALPQSLQAAKHNNKRNERQANNIIALNLADVSTNAVISRRENSTTVTSETPNEEANNYNQITQPGASLFHAKVCHQCNIAIDMGNGNDTLFSCSMLHRFQTGNMSCNTTYCLNCLNRNYIERINEAPVLLSSNLSGLAVECPRCREVCNCENCSPSRLNMYSQIVQIKELHRSLLAIAELNKFSDSLLREQTQGDGGESFSSAIAQGSVSNPAVSAPNLEFLAARAQINQITQQQNTLLSQLLQIKQQEVMTQLRQQQQQQQQNASAMSINQNQGLAELLRYQQYHPQQQQAPNNIAQNMSSEPANLPNNSMRVTGQLANIQQQAQSFHRNHFPS
jgi:hypothetical protein